MFSSLWELSRGRKSVSLFAAAVRSSSRPPFWLSKTVLRLLRCWFPFKLNFGKPLIFSYSMRFSCFLWSVFDFLFAFLHFSVLKSCMSVIVVTLCLCEPGHPWPFSLVEVGSACHATERCCRLFRRELGNDQGFAGDATSLGKCRVPVVFKTTHPILSVFLCFCFAEPPKSDDHLGPHGWAIGRAEKGQKEGWWPGVWAKQGQACTGCSHMKKLW